MTMTLRVEIVSAEAKIFSGVAEMVVATAAYGEVGIVPRHAQMLTALKPGYVRVIKAGGEEEIFYIASGGFLEVQPDAVTILANTASRAADLDEHAALEAKKRAEIELTQRHANFDYSRARVELAEAIAQIQAISKLKKKYTSHN